MTQLPLYLTPPRPKTAAQQHIDRAGVIARQMPGVRQKAAKQWLARRLLRELAQALRT